MSVAVAVSSPHRAQALELVQAVREHRTAADPIIAQHGGRVFKTTGDGVLIELAR